MACSSCGQKTGASVAYEVTTNKGNTYTVNTTAEARLKITTEGGGTYRPVARKA